MKVLGYIAAFVVGTAAGVAGGYFFAKRRYEKEIADFKAEYRQRNKKFTEEALQRAKTNDELKAEILRRAEEARAQAAEEERVKAESTTANSGNVIDMNRYNNIIQENGYNNPKPKNKPARPIRKEGEPYVIDQDEYDDEDHVNYEKDIEFTLWANGVVTDEMDEQMDADEVEDTIGHRWKYFFEDNPAKDVCFIRNEEKEVDYTLKRSGYAY